ncbi:hypothetical protein COLO4_24775 [Corchorus olitorius]|uniref:Uncharacterized protein n=1 Tax=Corchorus olitorius TaxID=93759 RepID=A0A1R3I701_9ROSI|nr:hypothetical protein COLO4_24775 [Corchorus olitorius]
MRANSSLLLRPVSMLGFTENPTKTPQTNEARANFLPQICQEVNVATRGEGSCQTNGIFGKG